MVAAVPGFLLSWFMLPQLGSCGDLVNQTAQIQCRHGFAHVGQQLQAFHPSSLSLLCEQWQGAAMRDKEKSVVKAKEGDCGLFLWLIVAAGGSPCDSLVVCGILGLKEHTRSLCGSCMGDCSQSSVQLCCCLMSAHAGQIPCLQAEPQWAALCIYQTCLFLETCAFRKEQNRHCST